MHSWWPVNMWDETTPILIVSASGRTLACAARRAGFVTRVLDLFNDADTRACAQMSEAVPVLDSGFDPEALLAAAERLAPVDHGFGLVYGSGIEHSPALLERLAWGRVLLGNDPEVLRVVKDPALFFSLLARLGIPHPETRLERPAQPEGWLVKRVGGSGGGHVRFLDAEASECTECYFQRRLDGRSLSALFLANGQAVRIAGYSEQWQADDTAAGRAFLYGGAIALEGPPPGVEEGLHDAVFELVATVGLRGLCSIDFLLNEAGFHVLEVNPRPGATLELHDGEDSLFRWHVLACQGRPPERLRRPPGIRGYIVLYAERTLQVPEAVRWPVWAADRPVAGTVIEAGQPVCTVCAEAADGESVRRLVQVRQQQVRDGMARWEVT